MSMLRIAYIGDSVWELIVRNHLIRKGLNVHHMHSECIRLVNARAQASFLQSVLPLLSETELEFFRKKALGIFNEGTAKEILPSAFNFPVSENSILYLKWISELTVGYMLMGTKHKFAPEWLDFYVSTVFEMIECGIKYIKNDGDVA